MNKYNNNLTSYSTVLLVLLTLDFGFILLHFYNSVLIPDSQFSPLFSLVDDRSLAEKFQYFKWAMLAILFIYICVKNSYIQYLSWALIFLYLLLDDSLTLHERVGGYLMQDQTWQAPLGLRLQDIGELLVTAIAGAILFPLLALAYFKGNLVFKQVTKDMLVLFFVLAIFGVGIDMLGQMVDPGRYLTFVFEVVEDGGEMFIASAMLWYAYVVAKDNKGGIFGYIHSLLLNLNLIKA